MTSGNRKLGFVSATVATILLTVTFVLQARGESESVSLTSARPESLSAPWPASISDRPENGLESIGAARPVLYVTLGAVHIPKGIRARIKVYVNKPTLITEATNDQEGYVGNFSIFPADASESAARSFAFDMTPYLQSLTDTRRREIVKDDLAVTLVLVPFNEEDDISEALIEIHSTEIKLHNG